MTYPGIDEIDYKQRLEAAKKLHEAFNKTIEELMRGKSPKLIIPKRTLSNTIYDPERKLLLLGPAKLKRSFTDVNEAKRFMQTVLMARILYESLLNNEYPTIRDLYYRGKYSITYMDLRDRRKKSENTWEEQKESDAAIRDIEVFTGLLREDMLVLSKEKGKLVGRIKLRSGGDVIDASKMGHGAYALESTPDLIDILEVDAEYVLVVEKDAVFQQLHRIKFWDKHKAILITSAGQPDRATRRFVRRLNEEFGLPVYILTDADPYGWYIYSVFKVGSITLSYESERLATPQARFIGVMMTDILTKEEMRNVLARMKNLRKRNLEDILNILRNKPYIDSKERRNVIIKAKEADIKRAEQLKGYTWFKSFRWRLELEAFLRYKIKVEIEALASKGLRFLAEKYIPEKIETGDCID